MRLGRGRGAATALGCAAALALLSCGDGAAPGPDVTLTSDATTVALGQRVTLTWTTTAADSCIAAGAWSGSKAANGSESVPVPLTQTRNEFRLTCGDGGKTAHAMVVITVRPPRLSLQALPLSVAVDLNDAGDVLGYLTNDAPAVWTTAGVLSINVGGPWCPPGGTVVPLGVSAFALNNARTVAARVHWGPRFDTSCLVPLGGQRLPEGGLPIDDPRALNDSLYVVGRGYSGLQLGVPPPTDKAVLFSAGPLAVVQPPGSLDGMATVINEAGVVAGQYTTSVGGPVHVFRYDNGLSADLGTLSNALPTPLAINTAGTIVGELQLPSGDVRAFRVRAGAGALEALHDRVGGQSQATGVNDLEQVLGSQALADAPYTWRATLLSAGTLYDLNDSVVGAAGVTLNFGIDINNAGQVLALGCDATGEDCRPYLLTPVEQR